MLPAPRRGVSGILCVSVDSVSCADDKSVFDVDGKLVHCCMPGDRWLEPFVLDVSQHEPDELGGRFIAGEVSPAADCLADLAMETLDRIGGVDHPPSQLPTPQGHPPHRAVREGVRHDQRTLTNL